MDFSTFDDRLDRIELDPRVAAKRQVRNVVEVRMRGIPETVAADIGRSRLTALADRIAGAIERGNLTAIDELIDAFEIDLMNAIRDARERGALRPPTNGVEERLGILQAHGNGPAELENIRAMITPNDPLKTVGFFHLETESGRRIARDEIRAFGRPESWSNTTSWVARFVTDAEVRRIQELAESRERDVAAPWSQNRNFDYPNGVRPR